METKSISRLSLSNDLLGVGDIFAMYMLDKSSLYFVSKEGLFFIYSLNNANLLQLQGRKEIVFYNVS